MPDISLEVKQEALALVRDTTIEANFDECKAALTKMMEPYKSLIVTEDGIAAAKADRARIRKVAAGIDEMRKTVKRAYTEPLAAFEVRCKELVAICDEGSGNIDRQVKEYEQRERDAKIAEIRAYYAAQVGVLREYLPWDAVNDPKWGNKGVSVGEAKCAIMEAVQNTANDLASIRSVGGDDTPYLLKEYQRTRNIGETMRLMSELRAQRAAEAKRKAAAHEPELPVEAATDELSTGDLLAEAAERAAAEAQSELCKVTFTVFATDRQLLSLKGFLRANGIKYGRALE